MIAPWPPSFDDRPRGLGRQHARWAEDAANAYGRRTLREQQEELRRKTEHWWILFLLGLFTLIELESEFDNALAKAQTAVYIAGLRARGLAPTLITPDIAFLHGAHSKQMRYFHGFLRDIEAAAEAQNWQPNPDAPTPIESPGMDFRARFRLYALSLPSVYNYAYWGRDIFADNARFLWLLGVAEHCKDCLKRAAESRAKGGYTWRELQELGPPGTGRTACRQNCKCRIEEVES